MITPDMYTSHIHSYSSSYYFYAHGSKDPDH